MSIFKDTIRPFIANQLEARKIIVSQYGDTGKKNSKGDPIYAAGMVPRADDFLRYVSGKNSWVRMSSFVDCYDEAISKDGKSYNKGVKIGKNTYYGSELARKYVLEGGTLYEASPGKFTLRSGVAKESGVYASNIDLGGTIADYSFRPFGYRPMPGITSIDVNSKSAYGSLREATIKFYCWDKHQLEELELLYMRTGYTILLEWGWSQYLNSKDLSNIRIENFNKPTIDIFTQTNNPIFSPPSDKTSDEVIYDKIDNLQIQHYGNYDAMLGHIKNFSWNLMPNGGFDCTTVLISRGEIISGLKLNSNSVSFVSSFNPEAPPLSLFEQIFLNYAGILNSSEFEKAADAVGQFSSGSSISPGTVEDFKKDLTDKYTKVNLVGSDGSRYTGESKPGFILQTSGFDGTGIEYIKMTQFIALLNMYFNIKDNKNKVISQVIIPVDTPCLASEDSVSVDPGTCLIYNPKATFVTQDTVNGFNPLTLDSLTVDNNGVRTYTKSSLEPFLIGSSTSLGNIGNIYIAIPKILESYRTTGGNDTDILLIPFLKNILAQISKALGGINDFQLHTTKSSIQIIDVKYLEQKGNFSSKYEFDLVGLKSICRDVRITSRIFESQATMAAIAAGSQNNVGDVYSSTQNYFNKGLRDRILPEKQIFYENKSEFQKTQEIFNNLISLQSYLVNKCSGLETNTAIGPQIIYPTSQEVTNASALLKTLQLQINGKDTDFKAIIPFELELTLDGISGLVIGQIFTINKNILPQTYVNKKIGFIITGISHTLSNNDWVTKIKTQCCLVDNEDIKVERINKNNLKSNLEKILEVRKQNIVLWSAIADYMVTRAEILYNSGVDLKKSTVDVAAEYVNLKEKEYLKTVLLSGGSPKPVRLQNPDGVRSIYLPFFKQDGKANSELWGPYDSFYKNFGLGEKFATYYKNVWLPAAKLKYPSVDFSKSETIEAATLTESGKIVNRYEDLAGIFNLPFSYDFDATGVFEAGSQYRSDRLTADCFLFRDPNNVNAMKSGWNSYFVPDPYQPYAFKPDSLLNAAFIIEKEIIVNEKGEEISASTASSSTTSKRVKQYYFNFPTTGTALNKNSLYRIFYAYLCNEAQPGSDAVSGFFSKIPDQAKPITSDLNKDGETSFTIY